MRRGAFAALLIALAALLAGLCIWQVERLQWKRALIARVEARLAAPPRPIPDHAAWRSIGPDDAYTRVVAAGTWLPVKPAFVQAVTDFGGGFWVLAPLRTGRGTVLVNRGFVPTDARATIAPPTGDARVTGLMRVTEPGGGFLCANDPAADRWYSRDASAIAVSRGLRDVAPFFIDSDKRQDAAWPRGGLTVVRFPNNHLVYAATWLALALLALWGAWRVWVSDR